MLCIALTLFLVFQPGSRLRNMWSAYRTTVDMERWASEHWSQLASASTPLFTGDDSISVVEISDFECPFCRASNAAVDSALRAGLRIAYLNYPLQFHSQAAGAASAALCADEADRFRQMHDRLMSTTQWQADSNWTREAEAVELPDLAAFADCIKSTRVQTRLAAEQALVSALKVRGTPTFVTKRRVHEGTISFRELMAFGGAR